jgi:adenosine deaminase
MLELGLHATINSDDPAYFGGYLAENWIRTADAIGLSRADLLTLAKNSFTGSFLTPAEIAPHLAAIDAYAAANA